MTKLRPLFISAAIYLTWMIGCPSVPISTGKFLNPHFEVDAAGIPTAMLFDYDFTKSNNRACSSTVTVNCVSGFTLTTLSGSTQLGSAVSVPLPTTISTTGVTVNISSPYTAPTNLGSYSACLQVNYKDAAGVVQGGTQACLGFSILPDTPLNVRVQ